MRAPRWILELINKGWSNYENSVARPLEERLETPALELPRADRWVQGVAVTGMTALSLLAIWSVVARLDVVVAAPGKLTPRSALQSVQTKTGGTVTSVFVQEGQKVRRGDLLMQLDKTPLLNQLESLARQREPLVRQVAVLRSVVQGKPVSQIGQEITAIPPELISQAQNRQLLVAQITGDPTGLSPDMMQRFQLFQQKIGDLQALGEIQLGSLSIQSAGADAAAETTAARLQIEQEKLRRMENLVQEGVIARNVYLDGVSRVNDLQNQFNQNQVQSNSLRFSQAQAQVTGRDSVSQLLLQTQTELRGVDNALNSKIEATQQQITQIEGQIAQLQINLQAQDVKAPTDGFIVNLKTRIPGLVAGAGETLLQVTPDEKQVARIQVANKDIGNIAVGQEVDVRIDAFPFTEFGALKGRVTKISADSVPSDPNNPASPSVFPVEVELENTRLEKQDRNTELTPGMTVVGNIKVRQRAPITLIYDRLAKGSDAINSVR